MHISDKTVSVGTVISVFGMSCCLPLFAIVGSAIGPGFPARYEYRIFYAIRVAVILAVAGTLPAFRRHKKVLPVGLSLLSAALILYSINTTPDSRLIYIGMIGLIGTTILNAV